MIQQISLSNFRNFISRSFSLSSSITVIIGSNGVGKTNILESVYLLSTAKSFKADLEEEMIQYNSEIGRINGKIGDQNLEVVLTRGEIGLETGRPEKSARKRVLINGVAKRQIDFTGIFKTVLFGPQDLDLVTESPSIRRRFLDSVLCQVDREYHRSLLSYEKGLRQRNRLLFRIREEGLSRSQLLFWNQLLIKNGDYLSIKRGEFIDFVNKTKQLQDISYSLEYDKSVISQSRLDQYSHEEVAAATTLVGPHRDDFVFKITRDELRDLSKFGSRGEQRMGVLWLKLAELEFVENKSGERPTLLLDDILSELDHEHRDIVMKVANNQQTILTTADPHFVIEIDGVEKIELSG